MTDDKTEPPTGKHMKEAISRTLTVVRLILSYWDFQRGTYDPEIDYDARAEELCDCFIEEFAAWNQATRLDEEGK